MQKNQGSGVESLSKIAVKQPKKKIHCVFERVQSLILVSAANQSLLMKNNVTIKENPRPFRKLDTNSNEE